MTPSRRQLILYATPTGPLASMCDQFFDAARRLGPTTAQTYPPHCTLTGFFHRTDQSTSRALSEIGPLLAQARPVPADAVTVVGITSSDSWVGLELRSEWLNSLARQVATVHQPGPDDDAIRLKDWLHLSLAYGEVDDLTPYVQLAHQIVDSTVAGGWEVALWERQPGHSWHRFATPDSDAVSH